MLKNIILENLKEVGTFRITRRIKKLGLESLLIMETKFLNDDATLAQRIWHILNDSNNREICQCGSNDKKFVEGKYNKFCSASCISGIEHKSKIMKSISSSYSVKKKAEINKKRAATNLVEYKHVAAHTKKGRDAHKSHYDDSEFVNDCIEKQKNTMLKEHGVEYAVYLPKCKENLEKKLLEAGVENALQLKSSKEARKQVGWTDQIEKQNRTRFDNYYEEYTKELLNNGYKILCTKEEFIGITENSYQYEHIECGHTFEYRNSGSSYTSPICRRCHPINGFNSKQEKEVYDFVKQYFPDVYQRDRTILGKNQLELDIVIPSVKMAIEYCGMWCHGEKRGKTKTSHSFKTEKCEKEGYQLITIFDDEWIKKPDAVKQELLNIFGLYETPTITKIELTENSNIEEFIKNNTVQEYKAPDFTYVAFENDTILGLISFSLDYEILSYTTNRIIFNEIITKFLEDFSPDNITVKIDLRYDNGKLFQSLGMELLETLEPECFFVKNGRNPSRTTLEDSDIVWDCGYKLFKL